MTRRDLLLLGLGSSASAQSVSYDGEDVARWLKFHHTWYRFLAEYFGCGGELHYDLSECRAARGRVNQREFKEARDLAKRVFDLRD